MIAHKKCRACGLSKTSGKKIGRLIITSRRQENVEVEPILVEGLDENDSIRLLNRLAEVYDAQPIIQAGEKNLEPQQTN